MKYLILFILFGCSTMTKEECTSADWKSLGHSDAFRGKSSDHFVKRNKSCSKHGITASLNDYKIGYKKGLALFCTDQRGLNDGELGLEYELICDSDRFVSFAFNYEKGLRSFCSAQNAIQLGQAGKSYPQICAPDKFINYYRHYTREKSIYDHNKALTETRHEHFLIHQKILLNTRKLSCNYESDCNQEYSCTFNKCSQSGLECNYDSDCSFKGICDSSKVCRF